MRFSYHWLKEFVEITESTQQFADKITMAGLEVDAIEPAAADFKNIVVGEIIDIQPHPNADRLRVCQVNVGQADPLTIVCGASNVDTGMKAPTALVGASLPGIKKLKSSKLRGVKSSGMLCSATELGLNDEASGLMPLPREAENGTCIRELLTLDDQCIEVDLTPNRGDCLSLMGLARESATLYNTVCRFPDIPTIEEQCDDTLNISLENPTACPRYVGRIIRNINNQSATPLWMQEKLRRSGIRPISITVDITNYVMLELGQPMHAFDLDKITGSITVRNAHAEETLELLDGKTITLQPETLVIADKKNALALAGIMGGAASSVDESTHSIFLEAAFFAPLALAGQARQHGLHTDSSHRFERGVDAHLPRLAIERATQLLLEIAGGTPGPVMEVTSRKDLPSHSDIILRKEHLASILGQVIPDKAVEKILQNLGFKITASDNTWQVQVPSFRFDIAIEADLIEEIARIYGYDNLPSNPQQLTLEPKAASETKINEHYRQFLISRGYAETINYSFISKELHTCFFFDMPTLPLENPISDALSVMRTSLWPGLSLALKFNVNRQQSRIRLFETGRVFLTDESQSINEIETFAGIVTGNRYPEHWNAGNEPIDFYDVKADLEILLKQALSTDIVFYEDQLDCLHPGQSARICRLSDTQKTLGWIGKIHPSLATKLEIPENTYLFECTHEILQARPTTVFKTLPRFPSVNRDLAFLVDQKTNADDLVRVIKETAGKQLIHVIIFDVYTGKGVEEHKKSVALRLTFQDFSRTLVDEEINPIINKIVEKLDVSHGAKLRDA